MNKDWQKVTLGEICSMKYGKMPDKKDLVDKGYPVFSGYRIVGFSKNYLYEKPKLIIVARGVGGTGDVKISPPMSWVTNLSIVLDFPEDKTDKKFLFYKLRIANLIKPANKRKYDKIGGKKVAVK